MVVEIFIMKTGLRAHIRVMGTAKHIHLVYFLNAFLPGILQICGAFYSAVTFTTLITL